jgi:hypothetical protein
VLVAEHIAPSQTPDISAGYPLIVVVTPYTGELLSVWARPEIAAAARMVDYVLIAGEGELKRVARRLKPMKPVPLRDVDAEHARRLVEHVQQRQTR